MKNKLLLLIAIFSISILSACNNEDMIIQERIKARKALENAKQHRAMDLAPEKYQAAEALLIKGETLVRDYKYKEALEALNQFYPLIDDAIKIATNKKSNGYDVNKSIKEAFPDKERKAEETKKARPQTYITKPGDYIWKIARDFKINPNDIFEANQSLKPTPDLIRPGQKIIIPNSQ